MFFVRKGTSCFLSKDGSDKSDTFRTRINVEFLPEEKVKCEKGSLAFSRGGYTLVIPANKVRIPPVILEAIQEGLRTLAGVCDGAQALDGQGFSGADSAFGKSLAASDFLSTKMALVGARFCRKYRRQLPPELVEQTSQLL